MNKREAVTFANRDGLQLFGTLHLPTDPHPDLPPIVLLSPGVKMRVGPHGLYNRMADTYTKLGFTVFKFDFAGLGDSEDELDHDLLAEVYNDTETGAFVADSIDALNWLEREFGYKRFILSGLCGGAITALLAAQSERRAIAILSLGMTVTLAMGARDRTRYATRGELDALRRGYIRRLFDPKSWLRLLTLKSDFQVIGRVLKQAFATGRKGSGSVAPTDSPSATNTNPLFPDAFFEVTKSGRRVLLIFSEADRLFWDFQEKFAEPYAGDLSAVADRYSLHVVPKANHVFSFREWEQEMLDVSSDWLTQNFTS